MRRGAHGRPEAPPTITWLGHATVLIELAGIRFLTDPALTPRLAFLRRHHCVDLTTVGGIDVVLISHVHLDHLHLPSLRLLGPDICLIVPTGAGAFLRRHGFRDVRETRAGGSIALGSVAVEAVRAVHPSRRGPHSLVRADPIGYVVRAPGRSVYFAGDTDLFSEMADLGAPDVALLPIWGWGPTLGDGHLDPDRAVQAAGLVASRLVVPIHWGTYSPVTLTGREPTWLRRPAGRFAEQLGAAGLADRLRVLEPGGRLSLSTEQDGSTQSG